MTKMILNAGESKPNLKLDLKKELRKRILQERNSLSLETRSNLSVEICNRFLNSDGFAQLKETAPLSVSVGLYRAFQSELDLSSLITPLRTLGWKTCFPRISLSDSKKLEFVEISQAMDPEISWKLSPYGMHEPHPELPSLSPTEIDLVFIPGVVFGCSGERVGRGAGHYDRFLSEAKQAFRIALAYDFQIIPELEQDPWDVSMHWILSEKRDIHDE